MLFEIDHRRLQRTIGAITGAKGHVNHEKLYTFKSRQPAGKPSIHNHFWSYISFLDQLLGESSYLATCLGLDEQVYRLLALSLLQAEGEIEKTKKRWAESPNNWKSPLDDLVDYIRCNVHRNLTLTDLEEQTHYSGRQLQNLFKEKFDCTPMQFVRRQRLTAAMERLQTAEASDTVTNIARDCGYLYSSTFTTDFKQEFGVSPSVVLRASRVG